MNRSYELTCKEEIKNELLNLSDDKKEFLFLQDEELLSGFYNDWLKFDAPLVDSMRGSINETITRKMIKALDER